MKTTYSLCEISLTLFNLLLLDRQYIPADLKDLQKGF